MNRANIVARKGKETGCFPLDPPARESCSVKDDVGEMGVCGVKSVYLVLGAAVVLGAGYLLLMRGDDQAVVVASAVERPLAEVVLPQQLSAEAAVGKRGFDANCAACHGLNAAGRDGAGPPLIHVIYEPNHHGDRAFYVAALNGVRQHHWPFGDMPAVEGVTEADVASIVIYVREVQAANGIY